MWNFKHEVHSFYRSVYAHTSLQLKLVRIYKHKGSRQGAAVSLESYLHATLRCRDLNADSTLATLSVRSYRLSFSSYQLSVAFKDNGMLIIWGPGLQMCFCGQQTWPAP